MKSKDMGFMRNMLCGMMSACTAVSVVQPLDMLKVRI
jgi:solute carrier family 25 (mitochondrial oxoglutarate transporter), member 11